MDALKEKVVEQYQVLNNQIMNDYYESNMPSHSKPQQSTDTKTVSKFIKDKYVKKMWVNEDDDDPVELYQSGELEKRLKKKAKKDKKKKEKKEKKRKKQDKKEANDDANLIDFQESDDFGDFQEGEQNQQQQDDGFGDLIGADSNNDNDFGDFATPEARNDDDFGDFAEPTPSTGIDMGLFNTAPAQVNTAQNSNLINNLSNLYNQNPTTNDPDNKYAALENLGGPSYPQQQHQPQQNSDMFFGMSMSGGSGFGFQQPQQNAFDNSGFPSMTHQHSYPPINNAFQPQSFPSQPFNSGFGGSTGMSSGMTSNQTHNFGFSGSSNSISSTQPSSNNGSKDLFGLKETLKKNNKLYKYNAGSSGAPQQNTNNSAFGGLVSAQWNA